MHSVAHSMNLKRPNFPNGPLRPTANTLPACSSVSGASAPIDKYVNTSEAMGGVTGKFKKWWQNRLFMAYLQQLSAVMAREGCIPIAPPPYMASPLLKKTIIKDTAKSFGGDNIFSREPPVFILSPPSKPILPFYERYSSVQSSEMKPCLEQLCGSLQKMAESKCEEDTVDKLRASCVCLERLKGKSFELPSTWPVQRIQVLFLNYLPQSATSKLSNLRVTDWIDW
jgi:hypothetical protein